jgi:hypothetical protein
VGGDAVREREPICQPILLGAPSVGDLDQGIGPGQDGTDDNRHDVQQVLPPKAGNPGMDGVDKGRGNAGGRMRGDGGNSRRPTAFDPTATPGLSTLDVSQSIMSLP